MTDTYRRDYLGHERRDGEHCKRCPEPDCNVCVNGAAKRPARRRVRHQGGGDE